MCVRDLDECYCPCHSNPEIKHCRPCCSECPKCGRRFRFGIQDHIKYCKGTLDRIRLTRSYSK